MKTAEDLKAFISGKQLTARLICGADFSSSARAASTLGLRQAQILKTILLKTARGFVFVYERGNLRISFEKLSDLGFPSARLAHDDEIIKISGYPKGGVPPIDLPLEVPKILDAVFKPDEIVFAGGGEPSCTLEIKVEDIIKLYKPIIASVSQ
jgi:prolyl-tRNA editing enzyme YbaK/EbsC (Cys-tRNA(Pro) deacylase)